MLPFYFQTRSTQMHHNSYLHHAKKGVSKQLLKAASVLRRGYLRSLCLPLFCWSLCRRLQLAEQAYVCNSAAFSIYLLLQCAYSSLKKKKTQTCRNSLWHRANSWKVLVLNAQYNYPFDVFVRAC